MRPGSRMGGGRNTALHQPSGIETKNILLQELVCWSSAQHLASNIMFTIITVLRWDDAHWACHIAEMADSLNQITSVLLKTCLFFFFLFYCQKQNPTSEIKIKLCISCNYCINFCVSVCYSTSAKMVGMILCC